jgi:hypothetical protein
MLGLTLRRPGVIPHALGAMWAFRDRRWYRKAPFLPLPPRDYLAWRMETAYGDADWVPSDDELERFLRWGSQMRRLM